MSKKSDFSPAIVQCPVVRDGSSIPLLMFSVGIYILPSYILIAFCMLSYILYIVQYCFIYVHAVTSFFKKGLFILVCRSKSPIGLMLHVVNIRHKIKFLCLGLYIFFWGGGGQKCYQLLSCCVDYCKHFIHAELICSISPNIQFEFWSAHMIWTFTDFEIKLCKSYPKLSFINLQILFCKYKSKIITLY